MAQESVTQDAAYSTQEHTDEHHSSKHLLGPLLCWGVVFADIGTSVYYTPGILYHTVQGLAGFFVLLTMIVFVLLTLKYAEVTYRFPQGGGVVTVAAQAINPWFGALGGMFIIVDYFLTASISCLSGIHYLSVVIPALGDYVEIVTIIAIALLGLLNWFGISESAKVSLIGGAIAFFSNIAIVITVFTHISFGEFLRLFPDMFTKATLTPFSLLTGFAGAFLAFSGLESISQLSPVMRTPRKKVASIALALVVITIGLTSPLLTLFATSPSILPANVIRDPQQSDQLISLLAGRVGGDILKTEVAISASALLVFAANTAIIGSYHVFMALSRMDFMPAFILKRNKLRGTPHYSILIATVAPILIIIMTQGSTEILGDLYAFGLLGAFSLTCLGLDIVRYRSYRKAKAIVQVREQTEAKEAEQAAPVEVHDLMRSNVQPVSNPPVKITQGEFNVMDTLKPWFKIDFALGILTTFLVTLAWSVNLVAKPHATAFGVSITVLGMGVAYLVHARNQKEGKVPVPMVVTRLEGHFPGSILAILMENNPHNDAVIRAAVNNASAQHPVLFLYLAEKKPRTTAPRMMEIVDPYLDDQQAKESFGKAENLALKAKIPMRKYVYLQEKPEIVSQIWQSLHPSDTLIAVENDDQFKNINPDRIRYELTPEGKVAHLLKRW